MRGFLGEIHAWPDDPSPKLAFADWWDQYDDPRAELIRSREALRLTPSNPEALARSLEAAAGILETDTEKVAVSARLRALLEVRSQIVHAADCAARVLRVYERQSPADDRPRRAVTACRAFAAREIGAEELSAAGALARQAADEADEPEWSVAVAAAVATEFFEPYGAQSAEMLAEAVVGMVAGRERAELEASWQMGRLIDLWLYGWDFPLPDSERNAI